MDELALRELVGGALLVVERDLPDEEPEQRRDAGDRDHLADALDLPGHARTMNTGVPRSTWLNNHSASGISMRMHP